MSEATPVTVSSSYASHVPPKVLRGHVIMGAIQITIGCLLIFLNIYGLLAGDLSVSVRTFSGFWTALFFIPAGATGVAGGRGGSNTKCCIISCLVLSILAACVGGGSAIITNSLFAYATASSWPCYVGQQQYLCFTPVDIPWFLLYLLELVVAIVQAAFACRASCCCLPDAVGYRELTAFPGQFDSAAAAFEQQQMQQQQLQFMGHPQSVLPPQQQQQQLSMAQPEPPSYDLDSGGRFI